jgi:hypothetical protein
VSVRLWFTDSNYSYGIFKLFFSTILWQNVCSLYTKHLYSPSILVWFILRNLLVFCVVFCRSLFVLVFFFCWPLWCLSFFDLQILIIPLVSSNSSSLQYCGRMYAVCKQNTWIHPRVFCVVFCRSLFVFLSFFTWTFWCLSVFDLRILITSLWYLQTLLNLATFYWSLLYHARKVSGHVSSNFSFIRCRCTNAFSLTHCGVCLSVFDWPILIIRMVSSNSFYLQ